MHVFSTVHLGCKVHVFYPKKIALTSGIASHPIIAFCSTKSLPYIRDGLTYVDLTSGMHCNTYANCLKVLIEHGVYGNSQCRYDVLDFFGGESA